MYDDVLFPTDGSDGATVALDHALDLAAAHDATIHVLHVADTTRDSVTTIRGEVVDALEEEGRAIVDAATDRAMDRGVEAVAEVMQGEPASTIVDYADDRGVDLVVMPTRGRRGLHRLLLGSTTERVVRRANVPVLTLRPDDDDVSLRYPYRTVLVPTDGSACADAALEEGIGVAKASGAALRALSVVDVASLGVDVRADVQLDSLEESARNIVERATATAREGGVESATGSVESGTSIHRGILAEVADHDVDLVVVGTHGRTGFDRYLLGSVTEKLIRTAPVPVLTVREPGDDVE